MFPHHLPFPLPLLLPPEISRKKRHDQQRQNQQRRYRLPLQDGTPGTPEEGTETALLGPGPDDAPASRRDHSQQRRRHSHRRRQSLLLPLHRSYPASPDMPLAAPTICGNGLALNSATGPAMLPASTATYRIALVRGLRHGRVAGGARIRLCRRRAWHPGRHPAARQLYRQLDQAARRTTSAKSSAPPPTRKIMSMQLPVFMPEYALGGR